MRHIRHRSRIHHSRSSGNSIEINPSNRTEIIIFIIAFTFLVLAFTSGKKILKIIFAVIGILLVILGIITIINGD
ncbi:MAG: hypothetical protein K2G63_01185 [Oscillospiraceae bacterium]|nr:hypothetical protein [Oscillospiraceae bacterium]